MPGLLNVSGRSVAIPRWAVDLSHVPLPGDLVSNLVGTRSWERLHVAAGALEQDSHEVVWLLPLVVTKHLHGVGGDPIWLDLVLSEVHEQLPRRFQHVLHIAWRNALVRVRQFV